MLGTYRLGVALMWLGGVFRWAFAAAVATIAGMTNPKLLRGRHSLPGAWYVVTVVASQRRPIFRDPCIARCVIEAIHRTSEQADTAAWTVMPDHLHWMFALRNGELGSAVQAMKSRSTLAINRLVGAQGPVWQRDYYDHLLRRDEDLRAQARYIIANPLRAGLAPRLAHYPFWWCRWIETEDDL